MIRGGRVRAVVVCRIGAALAFALGVGVPMSAVPAPRAREPACDRPEGVPIGGVELVGLERADEREVRAVLPSGEGSSASILGLARLEQAVLETGWFSDVRALIVPRDGGCALQVRLTEHPPVARVEIDGATAFDGGRALLGVLETKAGGAANARAVERDARRIAERYRRDGHEAVQVRSGGIAEGVVTFRVVEGRIAAVTVIGARRTGARRVREVLGIRPGDLYDSDALVDGQAALYRTGLFSSVGFGVEPETGDLPPELRDGALRLTVTVAEVHAPDSRMELVADEGFTAASIENRLRNVGGGRSVELRADLAGADAASLARGEVDEFFRFGAEAEMSLFRRDRDAPGGFLSLEAGRSSGIDRPDLRARLGEDRLLGTIGLDLPLREDGAATGMLALRGGARWLSIDALGDTAASGEAPAAGAGRLELPWLGGELGLTLRHQVGLETPSRLDLRAGISLDRGESPVTHATFRGESIFLASRRQRIEITADGGLLSGGSIPFWREFEIGGGRGPAGRSRDLAFGRGYARGRVEYVLSYPRPVLGIGFGAEGAVWAGGADGIPGATPAAPEIDDAESIFAVLRVGPEFARLRAGVAVTRPAALLEGARETGGSTWVFAGVVIATPY